MAAFELISKYDVLNAGRIKINNFFSGATGMFISGGSPYSILENNYTGNIASGTRSKTFGTTNYALGFGSAVLNGSGNTVGNTGTHSAILTGKLNVIESVYSSILAGTGNYISTTATNSSIVSGKANRVSGVQTFIGGGQQNSATTIYSSVVGGQLNVASSNRSFVGGGRSNSATTNAYAAVVGGRLNLASGINSFVGGGRGNSAITLSYATIVGGHNNKASGSTSFIGGGSSNINSASIGVIVGGGTNKLNNGANSGFIGGGLANSGGSGYYLFIGGGANNAVNSRLATIVGGGGSTYIFGSTGNIIASNSKGSFIGGGTLNVIDGARNSSIVGGGGLAYYNTGVGPGTGNKIRSNYSFIGGGAKNYVSGSSDYSVIVGGTGNTISGFRTFIGGGMSNSAITKCVVVGGVQNTAATQYSTIVGGIKNHLISGGFLLNGFGFIGGGYANTATSNSIVVGGIGNTASSGGAFVGGGGGGIFYSYANTASGTYSVVVGGVANRATASRASILGGRGNQAAHTYSSAFGGGAKTRGSFDIAIGGAAGTSVPNVNNNTILLSGATGDIAIEGVYRTGWADYAEYFEWADGNINDENRNGLFVCLTNGKIQIGNTNIIGIVSVNPGVIGDSAELKWSGLFLRDEWGTKLTDTYSAYTVSGHTVFVNNNGVVFKECPSPSNISGITYGQGVNIENLTPTIIQKISRINPDFNSNEEYVPRSQRKEWATIGLLGKIMVKTSEEITGNSIDIGSNGMAINGSKYPILKTVRTFAGNPYGIVQILFK